MVLAGACPGRGPARSGPDVTPAVRPGLEVLLSDSVHLVRGRRVALVTNQSGVDAAGRAGVDRLRGAGVHLVALFSPEHGFRGTADPGAAVTSTTDSATGLPIYSLYGRNSAPTDAQLAGVDVILVDLQDAGARYFTYLWTTVGVMRAAAPRGIPVVVLDRPNPIGGAVQGNVLDTAYRTPVGMLAIPMRHGMTLGELARLARHDLGLGTALTVVPVAGWRRQMYQDETGLPFVPPSPNLRTLDALIHYPGTCLFEGTTLSVGRGTEHPFEQVGAPGLDTAAVLAALRAAAPAGVSFQSVQFTPRRPGDGKFADTLVTGIRLTVTDRQRYDPIRTAVLLLAAVSDAGVPGGLFPPNPAHFDRLVGDGGHARGAVDLVIRGEGDARAGLLAEWAAELPRFLDRRRPFLVYPE
ncbi:MAG: DUF1343 domain-containing protein [Gemmatimonadetes bacterium]|nr:DUF1343 domain-containing protein [Gemmatimonadota bacterium]